MPEDFSDLVQDFGPADDFSDLIIDPGQEIQSGPLGNLDYWIGGQGSRNASDPYFDPEAGIQPNAREQAMLRAERRRAFLEANPMDFPELDTPTQTVLGLGQGALDLTRGAAGIADALRIPGARGLAESAGAEARELEELSTGRGTGVGGTLQTLGRAATSVIPSVLGGLLAGFPAAVAAGGAQSFGSVFEDAQDGFLNQGYSAPQARNMAYVPAIAAGLITAGVTSAFGRTGVEALSRGLTSKAVSQMIRAPLLEIMKGAGKEAVEEAIDQVGQGVVAMWSYDPDKDIADIVLEALQAGAIGGVLGGLGETAAAGVRKVTGSRKAPAPADPGTEPILEPPLPGPVVAEQDFLDQEDISIPEQEIFAPSEDISIPPVQQLPETTGLRRRERTPEALGARILAAMGVDEDIAKTFTAEFLKANPQTGTMEEMRANLIAAFQSSGIEAEQAASTYRENPADYQAMGFDEKQAQEYAKDAKAANKQTLQGIRNRNKQRMTGLRSRMAPTVPVPIVPPIQGGIDATQVGQIEQVSQPQYPQVEAGGVPAQTINRDSPVQSGPVAQEEAGPAAPVAPTPAPVTYRGQMGPLHLYDLTEEIPGHPKGSTVSTSTLLEAGFTIPEGMPGGELVGAENAQTEVVAPPAIPEDVTPAAPERSAEESLELDRINDKKQVTSEEMRRKEMIEKKVPRRPRERMQWGDLPEQMASIGIQIKGKKTGGKGSEGYYTEAYNQAITRNALKPLFTNRGGLAPDDALEMLRREGFMPDDATVDDMWDALLAAADARIAFRNNETREQKIAERDEKAHLEFVDLALENNRSTKKAQKAAKPVPVDTLMIGDEFEIDGEKFEVSALNIDAETDTLESIDVSDGRRFGVQTVDGARVIYPDRGKITPKPLGENEPFSIGDTGPSRTTRTVKAQGTDEIRSMLQQANLPANTKAVWLAWMDTPLMQELDWSFLKVELSDFIRTGVMGATLGRIVRLSEQAGPAVFPHEIAHIMFQALPKVYQNAIEAQRQSELKKRFGDNIPENLKSGTMTSRQFQESGLEMDVYPLSNAGEFLAHYVGDTFAAEAFKNRNNPPAIWTKIREWFDAMVDALKRSIGLDPSMEQVYREMIRGVWKPDLNAIIESEEQNSFSQTARQARNAAELVRSNEEREIEGKHQLAQSFDIVELFTKNGAGTVSYAAQKALGYLEYLGIRAVGIDLNNGQGLNYQQLKQITPDQYQRNWMARIASVHVAQLEASMKDAIKVGNEALAKLSSTAFIKKMARRAALEQKTTNAQNLNAAADAMLESAHKQAIKILREEAKTDLEIAEAEGQVKEIEAAMKSSSAMSILMNDIVTVLSSSPVGLQALSDPSITQKQIRDIYGDLKRSAGQPLFSPNLMNWASYILSRNAELRDALWAAQLARNSGMRAQLGAYEKKFLADLESDPLKTMRRELRGMKSRTTQFERARFAYLTLNKEVLKELAELQGQLEAKEVAENLLADQDFVNFRKEVYEDATVEGTQRPFAAFADKLLLLPSGKEVNVDPEFMKGSKTFFNQQRTRYLDAVAELETWLNDPANAEDPNWSIHRRNLGELQDYFTSLDNLKPADSMMIFKTALTTVRDAVEIAGGRMKAASLKAVAQWDRIKRKAGEWNQTWSAQLEGQRIKSMRSHGLKWSEFGQRDEVWANRLWWKNVGNFLAYTHQRQQGGFKVGDQLPSGWVVTDEDMADLKLQARMTSAGFEILGGDQITQDDMGKVGLFRKAIKGSENMTRRVFNDELLEFGKMYSALRASYQQAFKDQNQQDMALYEQQMIDLLNQHWDQVGFALAWDRNAEFAQATIFDGQGQAFDLVGNIMLQNPNAIGNFDQLIDQLMSFTANVTRDEAKQTVMVEWGRIIDQWYNQAKDDSEGRMILPVRGQLAKNATTKSRNNAMAPYAFYEYGFKNSRSVATFAGGLHSRPLDRVVAALVSTEQDLDRQIKALEASPDPKGLKTRNAIARKNGQTYDDSQSLDRRKAAIHNVLRELTGTDEDQDADMAVNSIARTTGNLTGMLVGQVRPTVRNFTTGPLYIGAQVNRILGSTRKTYPRAFISAWLLGTKVMGSGAYSGVKWLGKKFTYNISEMANAARLLSKGQFRGAYDSALYGLADALGNETFQRIEQTRKLIDAGLIFIPPYEQERQNAAMGSWIYGGKLAEKQMSLGIKMLNIPAALMEQPLFILKTAFSVWGDTAVNAATAGLVADAISSTEKRLKELYLDWERTNYRQFDFNNLQSDLNVFSAQEMFPTNSDKEKQFLEFKKVFQEAGLEFDALATKLIGELRIGNKQAKLLTEEESNKLINLSIDQVNRSSPAGSPLALRGRGPIKAILKPFMSWKTRTFQLFNRLLSVPAQSDRSRKAQWMAVAALLFLPLLLINALLVQPSAEEADRLLARVLHNQVKSSRQPWEREGVQSQAIGWAINGTLGIPFLDIAMNTALNDMPVRSSLKADVAMLEKAKDAIQYAGGVAQTGDPFFKLPELIAGFFPDSKAFLNRLESQEGKRESSNVIALMRRHGQTELLRPTGEVPGPNYTELSPYGPKLENAAVNGDLAEFKLIFDEAVAVAKAAGRKEPLQVVRQLFQHRNPYDRAFKAKLSEGQKREFMTRLSDSERAMVADIEQKFQAAANIAGVTFNTFKGENSSPRVNVHTRRDAGPGLRRVSSRRQSSGGLRRR